LISPLIRYNRDRYNWVWLYLPNKEKKVFKIWSPKYKHYVCGFERDRRDSEIEWMREREWECESVRGKEEDKVDGQTEVDN
jgi:hypothetical protein